MTRYCINFTSWIRLKVALMALMTPLLLVVAIAGDEPGTAQLSDKQVAVLFEALANAPTQLEGQLAENAIWQNWFNQAPTTAARGLLDAAIERREAYDFEAAEDHLDKLIETEPEYAEAYNQRAFIRFLRENLEESKDDLEKTLTMKPNHFAAKAGLYQVYSRLGELDKAWSKLVEAVTLNPWLKERGALPKDLWPKRYRQIHEPGQGI